MKKERLASLLMTGAIMASTVVSASAMQFPQDVYYPSDDTGLAQKVYMVETEKEIELLDRSSFTYKGKTYNYLDMTVEPQEVHDEKNMVKKVSGESDTNDKAKILATLEVNLDEVTEDGYAGELTLDASTLTTTVTEYGKGSQKKTVTKTYPGMSDGDLSLVPKTVTSGGATLQLETAPGVRMRSIIRMTPILATALLQPRHTPARLATAMLRVMPTRSITMEQWKRTRLRATSARSCSHRRKSLLIGMTSI